MTASKEDPQSLNKYAYVRNNPVTLTDPTGLDFNLNCDKNNGTTCQGGHQYYGTLPKGRVLMTHPRWTIALGCASYLVVLYFWMTMFLALGWIRQRPGDLFPLLIGICLSVGLSVPAAVKGAKLWYTSTALNAATLIWVM